MIIILDQIVIILNKLISKYQTAPGIDDGFFCEQKFGNGKFTVDLLSGEYLIIKTCFFIKFISFLCDISNVEMPISPFA
jgi:hypothetical protein